MSAEVPDPVFVLWRDGETFHSLLFTNDSQDERLLTGTESGRVLTWDLASGRVDTATASLDSGTSACLSLHRARDSLITQNKDGLVRTWRAQNNCWTLRDELRLDYFGFCRADASERLGGVVACPKEKSAVEVFLVDSGKKVAEFQHVESSKVGEVMACKIVDRNETPYLLAAYESGDLAVWDFKTSRIVSQLRVTGEDCPMAIDYDERTGRGVCGSSSDKVVVFKTDDRTELSLRHEFRMKSEGVSSVRFGHDRKVFAVGSWDGKVRLFASKTCRPLAVFDNHRSAILDMAFSAFPVTAHDSKHLLATSSKDGKISLLNVSF